MENWRDQGIVLAARAHGESGAVVCLLTESHGRHVGYVQGGQSSRLRGVLEPGNMVSAEWSSRVADGLGGYRLEQERHMGALLMHDPLRLGALQSACALCDAALPERQPHPGLYHGMLALIETMTSDIWGAAYVMWELALLRELGYGIELSRCAGGGDPMTLEWVSPKSGHAVSTAAGAPYKERLMPLPAFLKPQKGDANEEEILKGLRLAGYFLEHRVFAQSRNGMPPERLRFEERFAKTMKQQDSLQEVING
ncbi:MAG TPA: DNA repair protein RecO [Patescibacteria group bacterium]|nr:DNA repair protein RecO [Patescibacteria group bacterium]